MLVSPHGDKLVRRVRGADMGLSPSCTNPRGSVHSVTASVVVVLQSPAIVVATVATSGIMRSREGQVAGGELARTNEWALIGIAAGQVRYVGFSRASSRQRFIVAAQ